METYYEEVLFKATTERGDWAFENKWVKNYIIEKNEDGTFKLSICYDRYLNQNGDIINQPVWIVFPHCHKDEDSVLGYSCDSNDLKEDKTIFTITIPDEEVQNENISSNRYAK